MPASSYLDTWLRRTRKQLSASGRLSQVAAVLARDDGTPVADWEKTLREILDGGISPGLDVLTRIDAILAGTPKPAPDGEPPGQTDLFGS